MRCLDNIISIMSAIDASDLAMDVVVVVAATKTRQPHNIKWDEETNLLFLKAVLINKAYIRSNEKLEIK
jgi:hypothetical protein